MIIKHSFNSIVRSPGKSLLFLLLLTASIVFINLGSSMNYSANRMLDQADDHFDTVLALKYGDLHLEDGAWTDQNFQKNIANINTELIGQHPAVLAVNQERLLAAYNLESTEIWHPTSPVKNLVLIKLRPLNQQDNGTWSALSFDTYYGRLIQGTVMFNISPFDKQAQSISGRFEKGRSYLVLAEVIRTSGGTVLVPVQPASLVKNPGKEILNLDEIVDITDNEEFFYSQEALPWQNLAESLRVMDQSFHVIASSDIPSILAFQMKQTWLTSGSFEDDIPANSCYISERVAGVFDLKLGDIWQLSYHYDPDSNPLHSYWVDEGFAYEGSCTIAGIFHIIPEMTYTVLVPFPDWLQKAPDDYDFLRVRVENRQVDDYLAYLEPLLPNIVEIQIEDQGYGNAVVPILKMRERSLYMTAASLAAGVAVISLFAYLFIVRQRETADVMMKLGAGRTRTIAYLIFGILIISVLAALLAVLITSQLDSSLTQQIWTALQQQTMQDLRFSERALGLQVQFEPELVTSAWVRWLTSGGLVLLVLLITLIASFITLRKPRRRKPVRQPSLKKESGTAISFGWIPSLCLRFSLRSIRRNFLRSLIVPITVALLAYFIALISSSALQQEEAAHQIYDEVPTNAYLTTILGRQREFPIQLQADIFKMLNPDYQSRQLWQMARYPYSSEQIRDQRLNFEAENPYVDKILLTRYMHYEYMGVVSRADGSPGTPNLRHRPVVYEHGPYLGYDWYEAAVKRMPVVALTDSLTITSQGDKTRGENITWLSGYDDEDFRSANYIIVLPDRFMEENLLNFGDTIRVAFYEPDEYFGTMMEAYDFKVVGSYFQGSHEPVLYVPWSLLTQMSISSDQFYNLLDDPNEGQLDPDYLAPGEYLANFADAATLVPEDSRKLDDLRQYLEESGFSQVGVIRSNRLAVVIEDKALADGLIAIQQHLAFLNFIIPILYILSGVIAFILSFLLTRNRLPEFAIMRSLGAKPVQGYLAFFLEQLLLLLIGIVPVALVLYFNSTWGQAIQQNLLVFLGIYTLGILIAIAMMGKSKVLDILFTKE